MSVYLQMFLRSRVLATTVGGCALYASRHKRAAMSKRASHNLKLFEFGTTRSAHCRWVLLEAGLAFEAVECRPHAPEVKALNPSGKLPILVVDEQPLRHRGSAAICTFVSRC